MSLQAAIFSIYLSCLSQKMIWIIRNDDLSSSAQLSMAAQFERAGETSWGGAQRVRVVDFESLFTIIALLMYQ